MHAEEAETCSGCGQPLTESTDARNEFEYVPTVFRCHGCTAKDSAAEKYQKEKPGIYVGVKRRS
ncbi:MAG TPA: hypothetical protein VN088_08540 [Nocardioides sp.]|nr:hypothetical protein [Nocardioides sp.]